MSDLQIMRDRAAGIDVALRELRVQEAQMLKAQGLDEQAEKSMADAEGLKCQIAEVQSGIDELKVRRLEAVCVTAKALAEAGSTVLPEGTLALRVDEDGVFIGWTRPDGQLVPYAGLSGGQKVLVDAALAYALLGEAANRVLVIEAAELDDERLQGLMSHMARTNPNAQIILNTCHAPATVPDGWTRLEA